MAWLTLSQYYLFWLIPSAVSFLLSSLMALNIFLVPELRSRIYQQFLVLLAITDLIKTGSWFMGPKYVSPYSLCSVQEYLFQFGSMAQALVTVLICSVAYTTVLYRQVPSSRRLALHAGGLCTLLLISISTNIAYKTSRLFCSHSYSGFYEKHFERELHVYSFGNLFPILATVLINLFSYFAISRQFRRMNVVLNLKSSDAPLHILVYRLRAYPIIFAICYMPLLVTYVSTTLLGEFSLVVGTFAAVGVSSLGGAVAVNYFYYQNTLSPFVKSVVYFWKPLLVELGNETGRSGDAPLGSYVYNNHSHDDGGSLTDPILGGSSFEGEDDQGTITRYFPSIDVSEKTEYTVSTGKEYLLTVE